jgi:hypothetical protein
MNKKSNTSKFSNNFPKVFKVNKKEKYFSVDLDNKLEQILENNSIINIYNKGGYCNGI